MSEPLRYASAETIHIERVERAISVVGAVHAFACLVYVSQRSYRWFAGTETTLALSQPAAIATAGLLLQFVAALALLVTCLARVCCVTRLDRWIAVSAIALGLLWLYFGIADGFAKYMGAYNYTPDLQDGVLDLLRELNQAITPAVVAFVFVRRQSMKSIGWITFAMLVPACLCYLIPPIWYMTTIAQRVGWQTYLGYFTSWQTLSTSLILRQQLVEVTTFGAALLGILFLRRPWRIIAALPFAAWLVRDMVVNIPERMDRWSKLAGIDLVLVVSRNLSFVTAMSTATLLGVFVFTVAGVPKPRLFGGRAG